MLFAEAVIAEILGALLLGYVSIRHLRGSEGIAVALMILALTLFVFIPITQHFIS